MNHECPIKHQGVPDGTPFSQIIKVDGIPNQPPAFPYPLAYYLYSLPMHPPTDAELAEARQYEADPDIYCVILSAIIFRRIHPFEAQKISTTWSSTRLFEEYTSVDMSSRNCEFLLVYIHNMLHNGPKVPLIPINDTRISDTQQSFQ